MKRRDFIKQSSLASSLLMVPSFVKAFDGALSVKYGHKKLVIIQLTGGNDGLNTIIPYRNDWYYKNRPSIGVESSQVLKLTDDLGFHKSLQPLQKLYDQGYLSIINNVGYPNPDRSHFRSTDIWHTASASNQYWQNGWIGRFLDAHANASHGAIEVNESLSLLLKGAKHNGIATTDARRLFRLAQEPYFKNVVAHHKDQHLSEHNLGYLYKTMINAESSAKYIYEKTRLYSGQASYPDTGFAKQLKTIGQFINSGLDTKVYYASLSGFDTHANQNQKQSRLLSQYSEGIAAFVKDLKSQDSFKDTLILTFSEFGRRVKQNAANGTDHGSANNVFVIGEHLKTSGFYNQLASLEDLDANGDLKFEIDFRTIYATILKRWMYVNDEVILNAKFSALNLI
jgi:uncharacterized protein (DUF1501 family)